MQGQKPGMPDRNPHSGVQAWSKGDLFPAVIARVETYDRPMTGAEWRDANTQLAHHGRAEYLYRNYLANFYERSLAERVRMVRFHVWAPGYDGNAGFVSYAEAESFARALLEERAQVQARGAAARALEASRNPRGDLAAAWIANLREAA